MLDYILISITVYLWLMGGLFIAIAAADADFGGVPRGRIGLLVLGWPALTLYSLVLVFGPEAGVKIKRFWRLVRER